MSQSAMLKALQELNGFQRNHRFVLGERIEQTLDDLLETLIEARYSRARTPLFQRATLRLEILRFQMRVAAA